MYLWGHTAWKQRLSLMLFTHQWKNLEHRVSPLFIQMEEGKPWRGSTGPPASGGTGRVGGFLSNAAGLCSEVKTPRRKLVFLSAGEGFSVQRTRQWVSLKQEVLLSVEEVLLSKW